MEKKSIREIISVIFKAVTLAMGIAVVVLSMSTENFFFAVLWLIGMGVCLLFRRDPHIWILDAGHCGAEENGLKDLQRFYD